MTSLLIRNASVVVAMDDARTEIVNGGMFCRDGFIELVGSNEMLPASADQVLDLSGHILLPGLINTHHHF